MKLKHSWTAFFVSATTLAPLAACSEDPAFEVVEKDPDGLSFRQRDAEAVSVPSVEGENHTLPPVAEESTPANEQPRGENSSGASHPPVVEPPLPTKHQQEFVQNDRSKLDILWVIDNSGSMAEIQNQIRQNFRQFAEHMQTMDVDFQMGVTTTDVCTGRRQNPEDEACPGYQGPAGLQGQLHRVNGTSITSSLSANMLEEFSALSNVGIGGSSFEHGLTAVRQAVASETVDAPTGLKRNDSYLAIMVVSDEEDDGVGLSRPNEQGINYWKDGKTRYFYDAAALVADLKVMLPDGRFSLNAIVGTRQPSGSMCTYRSGNRQASALEEGAEYHKAATLTGGMTESICDESWSAKFDRLARGINNQLHAFKLDRLPLPASIVVFVNEAEADGWHFDQTQNAVVFRPEMLPPPGSSIRIEYQASLQ
jgi:hypothetical protein